MRSHAAQYNLRAIKVEGHPVALSYSCLKDTATLGLHLLDLKRRVAGVLHEKPQRLFCLYLDVLGKVAEVTNERLGEDQCPTHSS